MNQGQFRMLWNWKEFLNENNSGCCDANEISRRLLTVAMRDKICMITGANAGIGYETALGLARADATAILVCRNRARGETALKKIQADTGNEKIHLIVCDLASQVSVRQFVEEFKTRFDNLHVLINNAAMYSTERTVTEEGFETQFATNYLGYFLLTCLLLDTFKTSAPARIINLSTVNHRNASLDLDDLQSERSYVPKDVHMRSKLAVILFTYELARRIQGTGVTANCLHPGVIATNLLGEVRDVPPARRFTPEMGGDPLEVGARTPLFLAMSPKVQGVSGKYYDDCKAVRSSDETYDEDKARRLWQISLNLTGLTDELPEFA